MHKILINGQPLKTPLGNTFTVPSQTLKEAIEKEWKKDSAKHYKNKPLTSLIATFLDKVQPDRNTYISMIINSIPEDTLLFWDPKLMEIQKEKWQPCIDTINKTFDLKLEPTTGLTIQPLSVPEKKRLQDWVLQLSELQLTALCHFVTLTSSFGLSYLLFNKHLSPKETWELAFLHEHEQRRLWGEDSESIHREKEQKSEFMHTCKLLRVIK